MGEQEILEKLRNIPLFHAIKDNTGHMEMLQNACNVKSYGKDEVIIKEGEVGSEMYIVYTGGVEIQKKTRAGDSYTVVKLSAEHNVFFGELALIDDDKRSATVISSQESQFIVISKKDFLELGNTYPEIGLPITREIAKVLASRMRKTNEDMLTIFDALVNELKS